MTTARLGVRAGVAMAFLVVAGAVSPWWPLGTADAASPSPASNPSITLVAEPMLGGAFRHGTWAAIRVTVENSGPAVEGELRLSTTREAASISAVPIHLAPGARQEHFLYGRMEPFRNRFAVVLADGTAVHASVVVPVETNETAAATLAIVAERPQALVGLLGEPAVPGGAQPTIVAVTPSGLPPRVEPWRSVDVLVWQDVDSQLLDGPRIEALRTWVATGGHLVLLAGSTGPTTLAGFPADLLPYRPAEVVEVRLSDLEGFAGDVPDGAPPVPALTGPLERGVALAQTGDAVVAARTGYGVGTVTVVGFDPSVPPLAESAAASALSRWVLPAAGGGQDAQLAGDDSFLARALGNLPAVQLPRIDVVFLLIVAYIVVIGPLNYVLLRRRDRREWAWLTMPAAIVVFAAAAYGFGAAVRGSNVIVNQLAIARGAVGGDRALVEVHVAVYSPGRAAFDVRVGGDPLVSAPRLDEFDDFGRPRDHQPVDVLLGDPATLRGYRVGFGALRSFRADASLTTPRIDADLRLADGVLEGSVTNASDVSLSDVTVVYGNAFQRLGDVTPGASHEIAVDPRAGFGMGEGLSWRLFPGTEGGDPATVRATAARRALIQHLDGGWEEEFGAPGGGVFASGPTILAWQSGPTLDVDVGAAAEHVGERLLLLSARAAVAGPVVFSRGEIERSTVSIEAQDGWEDLGAYTVSRGTVVADYRPPAFDGSFAVSDLTFRLGVETTTGPTRAGDQELAPLPSAEQPDPDAPLATAPGREGPADVPRIQLFDRFAGTWVEFERADAGTSYRVRDPGRYVDRSGAFRVRFVVPSAEYVSFAFAPRLEGTVE